MKHKVLFLTNQTSPYMVSFFNELGKFVNLKVVFEQKSSNVLSWNKFSFNSFEGKLLDGIQFSKYGTFAPKIIFQLKKNYDFIIVTNPTSPTGILAILFMKIFFINYIIESEGGYPGSGFNLKEIIKKKIFTNAHSYLSGNSVGDQYLIKYGASKDKIFRYPFSSIHQKEILKKKTTKIKKINLRKDLLLNGEFLVLAVGRYSVEKNYKWLIAEWHKMPENVHLYIVGEGDEKKSLENEIWQKSLKNVHLIGYMDHVLLLNYMEAFDIFVHPTIYDVWGLVINEAMARGLPIISSEYCLSAKELIEDGINGYITKLDNSFIHKITHLLKSPRLMDLMSSNNLEKIQFYTIESMVNYHLFFFNEISDL